MLGKITEFAIETNRITVLFLIGIPLIGLLIFLDYPRQEDPSIEIREAIVTVFNPGMDVHEVEDLITRTVEEKIREIGEVDNIWSYSRNGAATIHVELADRVDANDFARIWQDLRNRMADVAHVLPGEPWGRSSTTSSG